MYFDFQYKNTTQSYTIEFLRFNIILFVILNTTFFYAHTNYDFIIMILRVP